MRIEAPFTHDEFTCGCGCGFCLYDDDLIDRLVAARFIAGIPFPINSWCRCKQHNKDEGGAKGSGHLIGQAVDIECVLSRDRFIMVDALLKAGFRRIYIYPRHIHADILFNFKPGVLAYREYPRHETCPIDSDGKKE